VGWVGATGVVTSCDEPGSGCCAASVETYSAKGSLLAKDCSTVLRKHVLPKLTIPGGSCDASLAPSTGPVNHTHHLLKHPGASKSHHTYKHSG